MSRYIDADAIIEKKWQAESEACFYALEDVVSVTDIEEAPSIDICFCRECKRWDRDRGKRNKMQFKGYCKLLSGFTDAKHFCAWSIPNTEESEGADDERMDSPRGQA